MPAQTSSATPGVAPKRRNGRQQACLPCHQKKVACDHTIPHCGRCQAKGKAEDCVYVPTGEMTAGASPAPKRRRLSASAVSVPAAQLRRSHVPSPPGYLGPTSFFPVFEEARTHLQAPLAEAEPPANPAGAVGEEEVPSSSPEMPEEALNPRVKLLACIPSRETSEALFKRHVNPMDGWVRGARPRLADALWETFGSCLRRRRAADLQAMAAVLSANTKKPLEEDSIHAEEWLRSFTGSQMRWESLGILFSFWAVGALAVPETAIVGVAGITDSRQQMIYYKKCVSQCVALAREMGTANTLQVYLCFRNQLLESTISGDASLEVWRLHGDAVALTTYLGLHCMPSPTPYEPTVASEVRRRLFGLVYNIDKVLATFTGRPPLLNARHTSTTLPLDIDDEVLLGDRDEMLTAARELEGLGGRPRNDGKLRSTTMLRSRVMMAFIRNDILDVALGPPHWDVASSLCQLRDRQLAVYARLPDIVVYRPEDRDDDRLEPATRYAKILVRLEHLQNLFFVQRLQGKHGQKDLSELISISFEMVSLTLLCWTHRDWFVGFAGDYEWLVMSYAAPAGGVLAMELLKPSPVPSSSSHGYGEPPSPRPKRSQIIQQLSLLVGFLEWVRPTNPNGDLCQAAAKVIKHILDQTLDASSLPAGDAVSWNVDFPTDLSNYFNFDLLDTFDWL